MRTYKTKLKLNNKQGTQLHKNAGVARFAYNLTLEIEQNNYKEYNKSLPDCDVRKVITQRKKTLHGYMTMTVILLSKLLKTLVKHIRDSLS